MYVVLYIVANTRRGNPPSPLGKGKKVAGGDRSKSESYLMYMYVCVLLVNEESITCISVHTTYSGNVYLLVPGGIHVHGIHTCTYIVIVM